MKIRLCREKKEWVEGLEKQKSTEFLQSWEWGEFQQSVGNEVVRLQVLEEGIIVSQIQGFVNKLPLGMRYLYVPRILNIEYGMLDLLKFFNISKYSFVRIESAVPIFDIPYPIFITTNRQPKTTLILDIDKLEGSLLEEMHAKTRYNIRLAEKKGVIIKQEKNAEIFWKLNQLTSDRDQFITHDKNYYRQMLKYPMVYQLTAYYQDKPIASNICVMSGHTFTYLHGASGNEYRNLMAPYLLQWEGMKLAKKLNCKFYDFWGIAPKTENRKQKTENRNIETCFHNLCWQADHRWTGVTRFKAGFGGEAKEYPQAVDLVLNKFKYFIYKTVRKLCPKN